MRKDISLLLTFVLAFSLPICGPSGINTADAAAVRTESEVRTASAEAETNPASRPESATSEWDPSVEKTFKYENGQILIDTEDVRICASSLKNKQKDDGMKLLGMVRIENLSGGPIRVSGYKEGHSKQSWTAKVDTGETKEAGGLTPINEWNGKVGNSQDCYQGKYMIRVTDDKKLLAAALFDWYTSETDPFENIITDEQEIASQWGEIVENYADPKENAIAAEGSRANDSLNEGSSADTPSESVTVYLGIVGTETNMAVWDAVRNTVASNDIDLCLLYIDNSPLSYLHMGQVDICPGMSNAALLETRKYLAMVGQDQLAEAYAGMAEDLCPVGYTTFSPLNIYSAKFSSLDELKNGASIVVPWEFSMGGFNTIRALNVLEAAGLITIKDPSEMPDYTNFTIEHYIKETLPGIELIYSAALGYREIMDDPSAYDALLLPQTAYGTVIFEDPNKDDPDYWEQIWVNKKDVTDPAKLDAFEKIVEAYQSDATTQLVENGVGWDVDLIEQYR